MTRKAISKKKLEEQSAYWDGAAIDEREWIDVTDLVELRIPLDQDTYNTLHQLAERKKRPIEQVAADLLHGALA